MPVFEIVTPGTWLDYQDKDRARNVENLLHELESQFFEANTALNLFLDARAKPAPMPSLDEWEQDRQRRWVIEQAIASERGGGAQSVEAREEIRFEAEVRFKREKWASGRPARQLEHKIPHIYARAFLFALDNFAKILGVLAKEPNVPATLAQFHAQMNGYFPDLLGVRNSAHHLEDRARALHGVGSNKKPIDLKPIDTPGIKAPAGTLALSNLQGSLYGCTMADGYYGQVDVSEASMARLQEVLQSVLKAFMWTGAKRHEPSV